MPKLKSSSKCSQEHFTPIYNPPADYSELIETKVIDNNGIVASVLKRIALDHPTKGLDSNHFRLEVILETNPESLGKVQFSFTDPMAVIDNYNSLNTQIDEILSK